MLAIRRAASRPLESFQLMPVCDLQCCPLLLKPASPPGFAPSGAAQVFPHPWGPIGPRRRRLDSPSEPSSCARADKLDGERTAE